MTGPLDERTTDDSDNIEILRRGYSALARRDFDAVFEIVDPEIVIRDRPEAPDPGVYHGYEGVVGAFDVSAEMFEQLEFVPEKFVAEGDHVAVAIRLVGRGRESGVPVEDRLTHLWRMREGKAVSLQVYSEMADALDAIGPQA
jgi:ketosteroid isomerase-like protein